MVIHSTIHTIVKHVALNYTALIVLFTLSGFFKALVADRFGDITPRIGGFVSLNPLAHIDVIGVLIMAILFALPLNTGISQVFFLVFLFSLYMFAGFRWRYFVPVNIINFRYPRLGLALSSLAAIFGFLCGGILSLYVQKYSFIYAARMGMNMTTLSVITDVCSSIAGWALTWSIIYLLPIPPFEGANLLLASSRRWGQKIYDFFEMYGLLVLLALFFLPGVSNVFAIFFDIMYRLLKSFMIFFVW